MAGEGVTGNIESKTVAEYLTAVYLPTNIACNVIWEKGI